MLSNYGYVGLFLVVAILFASILVILPVILRFTKIVPHNPSPMKNATFECGMETIGKTWVQFNFRFYFYALVFLALDVLVVFLYPWAVNVKSLDFSGLVAVIVLLLIVTTGYLYAWKKKVLEWK